MKTIRLFLAASLLMLTGSSLQAWSQQLTVSGTVKDETGAPLAAVYIVVKGANKSTVTNHEGRYTIVAKRGDVLTFSFIGYETKEERVTGPALDVTLIPSREEVADVVVTGMFSPRKEAFTGSARVMDFADFTESKVITSLNFDMHYPGREEYGSFTENTFIPVSKDPLSTFSLDVDGASYSNVRRMLNQGRKPAPDAVRVEEMVNYFTYDYAKPTGTDPVKINYEVGTCPWNTQHKLVSIGIKAREIPSEDLPPTNFVFLIDVSGSMSGRLELVKSSFKLLVNNLRGEDRVAIVTYAGDAGLKLPATSGSNKEMINDAIDALRASGSTAGGAGIKLAYKVARENYMKEGNNRIILATDGDFNVGVSSPQELEKLIEKERQSGVFLTVLGYGMGNYKDNRIQTLADKGNGNHAYIDNIQEANKVLVSEFGGTMHTVAKDVKLQVEFNPALVQSYRLVGYESRLLEHKDFNDDKKDAGELGVGHTVTALYEIVPVGVESPAAGTVDDLKYQPGKKKEETSVFAGKYSDELMTVKLRYKDPDGTKSKLMEVVIKDTRRAPSPDFHFASAVAMFGQLLRDSDFRGDASYDLVVSTARKGLSDDEYGYRREFIRLAEAAKGLRE